MALRLFNTLSRSVQDFAPLDGDAKPVRMYCCGPTVYDYAHIGNWRTFVFCDLVRRYLQFKGYAVQHVMNITDVEDKIIKRVGETGTTLGKFTATYENAFLEDLKTLNCLPPHQTPRASEHIGPIIDLIAKLVSNGIAYQASDGSVYFSIEKYRARGHRYGQLVNLNLDEMRVGERVRNDEYAKEAVADFALWKARVPEDGAVFWPSPWGEGRPGWHIECSAMSCKHLGPSFDLHLGGEDLMFPHHEDEIAQSEGAGLQAPGQRFVKYWLHGAHLQVEGNKMSKSLGNFFTLRDLLAKGSSGREIRCLLLSAHYRETFNFTQEGLQMARASLQRIDECLLKLRELAGTVEAPADTGLPSRFAAALDEDLNIAAAWGVVFDWVRETNRRIAGNALDVSAAASALAAWEKLDSVLGVCARSDRPCPANATDTAVAVGLSAFHVSPDGTTGRAIGGATVEQNSKIRLRMSLAYTPFGPSGPAAAFSGGRMVIQTADGAFSQDVTPPGGVPIIAPPADTCPGGCAAGGTNFFLSSFTEDFDISAHLAQIVRGKITFVGRYGPEGTVAHFCPPIADQIAGYTPIQVNVAAVPAEVTALLDGRQAARAAKDFKRADAIREELKSKGWIIEDTPKGARLKRTT